MGLIKINDLNEFFSKTDVINFINKGTNRRIGVIRKNYIKELIKSLTKCNWVNRVVLCINQEPDQKELSIILLYNNDVDIGKIHNDILMIINNVCKQYCGNDFDVANDIYVEPVENLQAYEESSNTCFELTKW